MYKKIYSFFYVLILFAFTGCSSVAVFQARNDNSCDISMTLDSGEKLSRTVSDMMTMYSQMLGLEVSDSGIFTKERALQMEQALSASDLQNVCVKALSPSKLSVTGNVPQNSMESSIVSCNSKSLSLTLSPRTIQTFAASLSPEMQMYLGLFMAPVFTGEKLTSDEYTGLIACLYGTDLAQELSNAKMNITLQSPQGKSKKSVFTIPLVEFLTLQEDKTYSIKW